MKSVKEISKELNVSHQTVYNHIEKNEMELNQYKKVLNGTQYYTEDGIRLLKKSMGLIIIEPNIETITPIQYLEEIKNNIEKVYKDNIRKDNEKALETINEVLGSSNKEIINYLIEENKRRDKEIELLKKQNIKTNELLIEIKQELNKSFLDKLFRR